VLTDAKNSYPTNVEVYLGKESDQNERTLPKREKKKNGCSGGTPY